jgi:hypothetical protein
MPDTSGNYTGSEWWLWEVYYDYTDRTTYQINNVAAVGVTRNANYSDFTYCNWDSYNYYNSVIVDWSCDRNGETGSDPARERRVYTGESDFIVPPQADNQYQDARYWVAANSTLTWIDMNALPRAFSTTWGLGDGDIPTHVVYGYGEDYINPPPTDSSAPTADDGYPFTVGKVINMSMWTYANGDCLTVTGNHEQLKNFQWEAIQTTTHNPSTGSDWITGTHVMDKTFDVMKLEEVTNFFTTYGGYGQPNTPDSDTTEMWWNDSAKNFVRMIDRLSYVGYEDWGIIDYNAYNVSATVNTFSDAGTGFNINVTIVNNECSTVNISVLALIMDMDVTSPDCSLPYPGGRTDYPDMHTWASIAEAIQYVVLDPGESTYVTWSNVGSSSTTNTYKLWCMGATDTIN